MKEKKAYPFSAEVSSRIKAIAIIGIIFYHMISCSPDFVSAFGVHSTIMSEELLMYLSSLGKIFVSVFVFISAYGISAGLKRKPDMDLKKYLGGRIKKLYFAYLVVFLLVQLYACVNHFAFGAEKWAGLTYKHDNIIMSVVYFVIDGMGLASAFGTPDFCGTWWYMSIAFALIGLIPMMKHLYDKYGLGFSAVAVVAVSYFFRYTALSRYIMVMLFGIICSEHDFFEKFNAKNKLFNYIICIVLLVVSVTARGEFSKNYMFDAIAAVILCYLIYSWTKYLGPINKVLDFIGKHSMNIFLISTPVYSYFMKELTYLSEYWFVDVLLCLIYSLILSIIIEWLKKLLMKIPAIQKSLQ